METIKEPIKIDNYNNDYIEKLYNIIVESKDSKQTFLNNLDLWQHFYNERYTIFKKHVLNEKLFAIIKFLLENEKGEIFDYFHDNIIELLNQTQENLTFSIRDSSQGSDNDINKLFSNLKNHDDLCNFLNTQELDDIFGNIKKYQTKTLELYTLDSLIVSLHRHFFSVSPDILNKTIVYISNHPILFQKESIKSNIMNKDLIFQYIEKIIPIKSFLGEKIEDDLLLQQIKKHKIKDKQLLLKVLATLSIESIYKMFDEDLTNFVNFLEQVNYLTELEKQAILIQTFDKFLEEEPLTLLPLIVKNNKSPLATRYLTNETVKKIINNASKDIPACFEDIELKYLLENNLVNLRFEANLAHFLQQKGVIENLKNFDIEGVKKQLKVSLDKKQNLSSLTLTQRTIKPDDTLEFKASKTLINDFFGETVSFRTVLELLKGYLEEKIELNLLQAMAIFRSLAIQVMKTLNIKNNGAYFYDDKITLEGYFLKDSKVIGINQQLVKRFLNKKETMYNRLSVFDTIFHEIKHAKINQNKINNIWDIEAYDMEKETILRRYDYNFYDNNYRQVKEEIQARISGSQMTLKFIENFFPEYLNAIQDKIVADLEKDTQLKQAQVPERKMDFLGNIAIMFNQGFDTLIKYNPTILKKHPILNLEYYPNGLPKCYEDIWLNRNEENKELIDGILMMRYSDISTQQLNSNYTK